MDAVIDSCSMHMLRALKCPLGKSEASWLVGSKVEFPGSGKTDILSMSMRLTHSISAVQVFDCVENDDVNLLNYKLEEKPHLIEARDEEAQTLLIVAAQKGCVNSLRELLKKNSKDVNETDKDETTALIAAVKENHEQCAVELYKNGADLTLTDKNGWGPVTWAAYRGHLPVVKRLLQWGGDPNESGPHGMNPVIWASGRGHQTVVEEFLEAGANPNSCDKYGTSALVWAARKGHVGVIKALLDKQADINKPGNNGWTPLIMAAKEGFEQVVALLLDRGADVNFLDHEKNSALILAVKYGHTEIVQKLAIHGAYINIRDKDGMPVLVTACKDGNVEIVRSLLKNYADVEAGDMSGKTALWYAVEENNVDVVKELLDHDAFTESKRKDGETPLLLAVNKRHVEITSLLLEKSADLFVSNKKGDTALHIAVRNRYRRIAEIILKDPRSARLLYQTNRAGETPYKIDQHHKKSVLKPFLGMVDDDRHLTGELLGHNAYATSLAELLSEPCLELPLTVGVYSKWGNNKNYFFKKLQQEIQAITQETHRTKLHFTTFGILSCLFFCGLIGVLFCALFHWTVGVGVGSILFIVCVAAFSLVLVWDTRLYERDFSKLTRNINEATALVNMIEALNDVLERTFGRVPSRLYRVLRPAAVEYVGLKYMRPQFKKCCCCVPKLVIFCFVVICGAISVILYSLDGWKHGSLVAGLQIAGACIVGIFLVVHITTFCSVIYSLLFSPKRRVSIVATQLGLKEEGFIHALKQEVELLTEIVLALDSFRNVQTRIILSLDGLDISEQQKVIHLVDSMNLLFTDADAPFVCMIAMDPRVMIRAIEQNFSDVLQDSHITALDYLRNIVHIPVFLPEPKTNFTVNLPDALLVSVEQLLLRQRRTSGFDLEWEGEVLELSTQHAHEHRKGNRFSESNGFPHSTILTIDDNGAAGCRLSRSFIDVSFERYEETPDLTHVLANNETLTPLGIQRLLHTTSLSGRLLRAKGIGFQWNALATWVSLVDAWPHRVSWLVLILEEFNVLPDNLPLKTLFTTTQAWMPISIGYEYAIDNDPVYFEAYLGNHYPVLRVEEARNFLPGTVNLDPAIRNQLSQGLRQKQKLTVNKSVIVDDGVDWESWDSVNMTSLSEEGVCMKLSQIHGISISLVHTYQTIIRENNINGQVLLECDIQELKDVMKMNFGDWQLFRAWIMRHRATQQTSQSCEAKPSSSWPSGQKHCERKTSNDTYHKMGNLPCGNSRANGKKYGRDEKRTNEKKDAVNNQPIPKIIVDPGSSFNSLPETEDVGDVTIEKMSTKQDKCIIENEESSKSTDSDVKTSNSTDVQDLYTIAPQASFIDTSDEENFDEVSPLTKGKSSTVPVASNNGFSKPSSSKHKVALSKGKDHYSNTMNPVEDEDESKRVTPILFTLSPTKKGTKQVVSVVATRELPASFSRPSSVPSTPVTRKPNIQVRTVKSPKSFRGFFPCSSSQIDEKRGTSSSSYTSRKKDISNDEKSVMLSHTDELNFTENHCDKQSNDRDLKMHILVKGEDKECGDHGFPKNRHESSFSSGSDEMRTVKKDLSHISRNIVMVYESEPPPSRESLLCQRNSKHDSLSDKGSNTNESFDDSPNNSDKGYESVDNSQFGESDEISYRLRTVDGCDRNSKPLNQRNAENCEPNKLHKINVVTNVPSDQTPSFWVPHQDQGAVTSDNNVTGNTGTSRQLENNVLSQTSV
ncbi:kinase D-interacting substrate of 220 kDa B-like isoform X3 [Xenia sp. Carnegie-2017]|uniref:kinase D-interacting substrate of 220 kDa B-like isoform X3 n=1 Tax=Xenia sp. Carnegie-2017 TaxID=2897299 RepID=UPI001F03EFF7|nr:kinase D-interacting substrate of 220 kDa B-like isoform X3 [Xenia sp. Carnegie-2017]